MVALKHCIFVALTFKKLLLSLLCKSNKNLLLNCKKLIGYFCSAVNVLSSNPCVAPFQKNKYIFFLIINMQR